MDKKVLEERDSVVLLSQNPTADAIPALEPQQSLSNNFANKSFQRVSAGTNKGCTTV